MWSLGQGLGWEILWKAKEIGFAVYAHVGGLESSQFTWVLDSPGPCNTAAPLLECCWPCQFIFPRFSSPTISENRAEITNHFQGSDEFIPVCKELSNPWEWVVEDAVLDERGFSSQVFSGKMVKFLILFCYCFLLKVGISLPHRINLWKILIFWSWGPRLCSQKIAIPLLALLARITASSEAALKSYKNLIK